MNDLGALRTRFLQDTAAVRLGNLSSELARVANLVRRAYLKPVPEVMRTAAWFIEWSLPEVSAELQSSLVELQVALSRWWQRWETVSLDQATLAEVERMCRERANWLLAASGLIDAVA